MQSMKVIEGNDQYWDSLFGWNIKGIGIHGIVEFNCGLLKRRNDEGYKVEM